MPRSQRRVLIRMYEQPLADRDAAGFIEREGGIPPIYATEPTAACGAAVSRISGGALSAIRPARDEDSRYAGSPTIETFAAS